MGYLEIRNVKTGEVIILGSGEQFKRKEGIPTVGKGQEVLDAIDKEGE